MMNILKNKLRFLTSVVVLMALVFNVAAQRTAYVIKGKVTDASGVIPGATVRIEGTSFGTVSNSEGTFSLNASLPAGSYKITASSVGYATTTQSVAMASQTIITQDFVLRDDVMSLDEVVVTGSTIKSSRRELGNSITSISSASLEKTGSSNLMSALQGKIPGAQITQNSGDPAGGISIRLRGVKSIQGNSDPLYVIDGVIVSNSSSNVSQTALGAQVGTATIGTNRMADITQPILKALA
jgi:outer membrane receptor protein involved in Fe transport